VRPKVEEEESTGVAENRCTVSWKCKDINNCEETAWKSSEETAWVSFGVGAKGGCRTRCKSSIETDYQQKRLPTAFTVKLSSDNRVECLDRHGYKTGIDYVVKPEDLKKPEAELQDKMLKDCWEFFMAIKTNELTKLPGKKKDDEEATDMVKRHPEYITEHSFEYKCEKAGTSTILVNGVEKQGAQEFPGCTGEECDDANLPTNHMAGLRPDEKQKVVENLDKIEKGEHVPQAVKEFVNVLKHDKAGIIWARMGTDPTVRKLRDTYEELLKDTGFQVGQLLKVADLTKDNHQTDDELNKIISEDDFKRFLAPCEPVAA